MIRLCWVLIALGSSSIYAAEPSLIAASRKGDVAQVRALLAAKVDVNAAATDTSTALHWAVQENHADVVNLLIDAGANVTAATRYKVTPLALAAENGNAAIIERLLKAGVDPNSTSEEGQTALMTAALNGRVDALKVLLTHGAKVTAVEPYRGQTALMWAAGEGNADAAALLVEFGGDVKSRSKAGYTALLLAVLNNQTEAVRTLLKLGANIEDKAPDGTTALNLAAVNAYYDLASVLVDLGANPNAPDPRGSALHTLAWLRKPGSDGAAGVGNTGHAPPLPSGRLTALDLAKMLLEHGADPNVRVSWKENRFGKEGGTARNPPNIQLGRHLLSYVGATPFYVAAKNGDAPYMKLLADHGANPTLGTRAGITPLMVAAGLDYWEGESPGPFTGVTEAERLEAVKLAVALGNDVNAHANFGGYPMTGDTAYTLLYYPHNIDALLDLGVGDPRWNGATPLIGAVVSGQPSIVQWLVDHGARVDDRTTLGWTPLLVADGVFFANAKKEFPQAAAILRKKLAADGVRTN